MKRRVNMSNSETYIGSMSPTIGVKEQRDLQHVSKEVGPMLTYQEFASIMMVYNKALDRIFKENGIKEKPYEN
jgi:hypothetical protein